MFKLRNICSNDITPRYFSESKLNTAIIDEQYQIVQVLTDRQWKRNHIIFSVHFTPDNIWTDYAKKLDMNKKIIIFGNYHSMAQYYRLLNFKKYDVYLIKD